jgi:hypothetical protein
MICASLFFMRACLSYVFLM